MIDWIKEPQGPVGKAILKHDGRVIEVEYQTDSFGIWVNFGDRWVGYSMGGAIGDDGLIRYDVSRRNSDVYWVEQEYDRTGGTASASGSLGGSKKSSKIKSQMPGKVVKIFVKEGDHVEKGDSLLVLEAMKMENEIRSPTSGKVVQVKVSAGQAIESGVLLLLIE